LGRKLTYPLFFALAFHNQLAYSNANWCINSGDDPSLSWSWSSNPRDYKANDNVTAYQLGLCSLWTRFCTSLHCFPLL